MNDIVQHTSNLAQNIYRPSEIINIFKELLYQQSLNAKVVCLRGIYLANGKQSYGGYYYDALRDENTQDELSIRLTQQQRDNLKNGNLVNVGGVLNRSITIKGSIQITLNISRIKVVQEQAIDEAEMKRVELRQKKASLGYKNVDGVLENLLFTDKRPQVALIYASSSITDKDFLSAIDAAKSAIDFNETRVNFSDSTKLVAELKRVDGMGCDVMALVRGGGSGLEKLDNLEVLEVVVNLKTPIICAVGHVEERSFLKQIVDKEVAVPFALGAYFSKIVEEVSEKKSQSRAVLTEQIKKQFQEQLDAGQKQNKALQEKLATLTKNQAEDSKKHAEQVAASQKQNKELQEKLENIQKSHLKELGKINMNQTELQKQLKSQQDEFNKSLTKLQEENAELNKNLNKSNSQNTEYIKQLSEANNRSKDLERQIQELKSQGQSSVGLWVVIVVAIVVIIILILFFK